MHNAWAEYYTHLSRIDMKHSGKVGNLCTIPLFAALISLVLILTFTIRAFVWNVRLSLSLLLLGFLCVMLMVEDFIRYKCLLYLLLLNLFFLFVSLTGIQRLAYFWVCAIPFISGYNSTREKEKQKAKAGRKRATLMALTSLPRIFVNATFRWCRNYRSQRRQRVVVEHIYKSRVNAGPILLKYLWSGQSLIAWEWLISGTRSDPRPVSRCHHLLPIDTTSTHSIFTLSLLFSSLFALVSSPLLADLKQNKTKSSPQKKTRTSTTTRHKSVRPSLLPSVAYST